MVDRVVLDTNVCLDLFLFDDPQGAELRQVLHRSCMQAVTDHACREEWLRVLHYPRLGLDETACKRAMSAFDAVLQLLHDVQALPEKRLPRCRDQDDQKFLELAARSRARWLISRDLELLRLHPRVERDFGFSIVTPSQWSERFTLV